MIVRARTVVTMNGPPIDNGAVEITGDRITEVGSFDQVRRSHTGEVLDLGEQILLPGLINAHCHLDYTGLRGQIKATDSFAEWIRAINAAKQKLSRPDYITSIENGLTEALRFGTTSMVNFEAFPDVAADVETPVRIWWLGELLDIRSRQSAHDFVDSAVQTLKSCEHWGLAPHAPFTASKSLYRRCQEVAFNPAIILSTHLAESEEEMEMFRDGSGPLFEFLQSIGRNMDDCGKTTPLSVFLDILNSGRPNEPSPWLVVHLNELSATDLKLLAGHKFHVVHCPRSHGYFGHHPFRYQQLRDLGFNICLGTDSLASNENLNLFAEMRAVSESHRDISCRDIVEMVTINPAGALHQESQLGRIQPGSYADLIAIRDSRKNDAFESIVAHCSLVNWSMIGGIARQPPS